MQSDHSFSRLFALCPLWLWPVLAVSLVGLGEQIRRLEARGAIGLEIRLSRWGQAYVARTHWATGPVPWRDPLYRLAMGDPVPEPRREHPALGILTDEAQAGWALDQFGPARRASLAPGRHRGETGSRHGRAGGAHVTATGVAKPAGLASIGRLSGLPARAPP